MPSRRVIAAFLAQRVAHLSPESGYQRTAAARAVGAFPNLGRVAMGAPMCILAVTKASAVSTRLKLAPTRNKFCNVLSFPHWVSLRYVTHVTKLVACGGKFQACEHDARFCDTRNAPRGPPPHPTLLPSAQRHFTLALFAHPALNTSDWCMSQPLLTSFLALPRRPARILSRERNVVVSLFDSTHTGLGCWINRGFVCYAYQHEPSVAQHRVETLGSLRRCTTDLYDTDCLNAILERHADEVAFAFAAPPGRDLSVIGARFWRQKRLQDPEFQERAVASIVAIDELFATWAVPYYISNPASSQLGKLWKPPRFKFQPCDYGGYLPTDDKHPLYHDCVPPRDAYTQQQGLWTGGGFRMPQTRPVKPKWRVYVAKSVGKTRRISPIVYSTTKSRGARASTPRGFAQAVCARLLGDGA